MTYTKSFALVCAIVTSLLFSSPAWATCPGGGQCYSAREAQTCLVCLDEQDALRALAKKKEAERNALAASLNITTGRLLESGDLLLKADAERMRLAVEVDARPTWWVVVGVGAAALLVGGVVGASVF